jgi:hypothetical protein
MRCAEHRCYVKSVIGTAPRNAWIVRALGNRSSATDLAGWCWWPVPGPLISDLRRRVGELTARFLECQSSRNSRRHMIPDSRHAAATTVLASKGLPAASNNRDT